ncbi:MAG: PepSY domain-containing protein [Paracoccaceae bacterium]|nr:PepSY domain-containing protein [Paracoccaceae bacterium]
MTRTILFTAALATATGLFALGAQASDDDRARLDNPPPRSEWMSIAELSAKLEAQGYTIREIEAEGGAWDVEMTDANGMKVEAYLHPVTGEPLPYGDDDDREREDG